MNNIDLHLFTAQLNTLLAIESEHAALEGVCELLRMHTAASLRLESRDERAVIEMLVDGDTTAVKADASEWLKLPILAGDTAIGSLNLHRLHPFSQNENLAARIALAICTILMRHREGLLSADKKRRVLAVRNLINSLSFSELEAATHIIKALQGDEGLLVAGHIADKLGFTRSVVTSSLRKLEGADLIESRSLGMKGTYIRVKDTLLTEELAKL
ncbi:MAG: hypothetical protein FWB91_10765 [Defluviitaleaceae bacterium]|nr:hypothetical protein [Defluviitaleaceae bacterium]